MKRPIKYKNGDYHFTIYPNGTLIRETNVENPKIEHPSSIDIKITNYCDLMCPYCHENSNINGLHADLNTLLDITETLPPGVEFALGGGNPISHPELIPFLKILKNRRIIANITINENHLVKYKVLRLVGKVYDFYENTPALVYETVSTG
jgi:MoaA/NifB/PqqE/SkfB family radical SAM enzyme